MELNISINAQEELCRDVIADLDMMGWYHERVDGIERIDIVKEILKRGVS